MTVLTAITNKKDVLKEQQCTEGAKFVAFTDEPINSRTWEIRPCPNIFGDPRRNAKLPKILSHLFVDDEYSLWMDGSINLKVPMRELVSKFLGDADICFFNHPLSHHGHRDCLYEEAEVCKKFKLDDPNIIDEQIARYRQQGYPEHNGLYAGNVILRRHTPKIIQFNNMWWAEVCRGSRRDQISLNYCLATLGIRANLFPGYHEAPYGQSEYFSYCYHNHNQ